jgi:hypothetical protein
MAYNISVAVGDKLTIFSEFSGDVVSDDDVSLPQALKTKTEAAIRLNARLRCERVFFIVDLPPNKCLEKEEWVTESGVSRLPPRTALPSRTGFSRTESGDRTCLAELPLTEPPLRDSAGISPDFAEVCTTPLLGCTGKTSTARRRRGTYEL